MNKLTKLLSVFVIAGAVGAGVAGIAACKTPEEPTHTHTAVTAWTNDANKHWHACTENDGAKLDEGDHVYDNEQDATCNTCGYTRTVVSAEADIPEGAVGIKVTLAHPEVELNKDTKFATVSAEDLELQYINSNQEVISGSTVDKSKCNVKIMRGTESLKIGDHLTKGKYIIMVSRSANVIGTANFTVNDPVKAGSLALKAGAVTTQEQGEDTISASLTWEVELASGAKEDAKKVTVTGIDTYSVGADKTATAELEMDGKTLIKEFKYTVTDKTGYAVQSAIINVNKLTAAASVVADTDLGNGVVVTAKSGKAIDIQASEKQADGKAFTQRIKMGGSPIKNGTLDGATIFRTLQFADLNAPVAGATSVKTKITIYASSSSSGTARKITLFKQSGTNGTDAALTQVGEPLEADGVTKLEYTVTEAGTYHIASASSGWYVHYIRVDKIIEGGTAEDQPINAAAGQTLASIEKDVPSAVQKFTVGDPFSSEGIQVLALYSNDVTCDVTKKDVSADATLEYSGYDMATPGQQTVTITYGGKKTTYSITVETEVEGIYGVEAELKTDFVTEIAADSADTSITIKKSDIVAKMLGENANATLSYTVKEGDKVIDDTTGLALEKGAHTLSVEITVTDGTKTYTETKTVEVTITKAAAGDLSTLATYSVAVSSSALSTESTGVFAWGGATALQSDHMKFGSNDDTLTITLNNMKADQVVVLDINVASGSDKVVTVAATATGATGSIVEHTLTKNVYSDVNGSTFTVTADGTVVITLKRAGGGGIKIKTVNVTVKGTPAA